MQCTNRERERVESQSIKYKQQDVFRGSSTELYVPAFTEKDFHPLGVPNSSLNQYNLHQGNTTTIHLYRRGIQTNTKSTSPRGSKPTISTSTKEGATNKRFLQLGGIFQPQTLSFFSQTNDPIE